MTETDLQRSIKQALEAAGFWVVRTAAAGKRSSRGIRNLEPGFPDLTIISPMLAFLETKMPGEKISAVQAAWHERATKKGVRVATVSSVMEALQTAIRWRSTP